VGEDEPHTEVQLQRMAGVLDALRSRGIDPGLVHIGATGAILAGVGSFADAVRPGLGLYGLAPRWADAGAAGLSPVMSLRALSLRIFDVPPGTPIGYGLRWRSGRAARMATLPIGYGDGWPRVHLNNGFALVRGHRVPMVGAISMDGLVVDITDVEGVTLDDEFVLIGRQGTEEITADEVARQRGTINYEVTTMLRERLPRRHGRS
jgi:alanine racemase